MYVRLFNDNGRMPLPIVMTFIISVGLLGTKVEQRIWKDYLIPSCFKMLGFR